jgi:subtilisin family serine protease
VFVLDTGIQSTHETFEGRVTHGYDAINSPPLKSDPHGHGTQVAGMSMLIHSPRSHLLPEGIIGGRDQGVNSKVNLIDVRVVNSNGFARTDDIIAGLDYAVGLSNLLTLFSSP